MDGILEAVNSIVIASRQQSSAEARILGVHVEGPFLNPDFHGSQPVEYIIKPSLQKAEKLVKTAQGLPLIVTLAPEAPGAAEVIDYLVKNGVVVSLGTRVPLTNRCKEPFPLAQQGYSFVQLNEVLSP